MVALFIQVVGCLMFIPAAMYVSFPLFLTAIFVVGAGVTALQTSANPYVSILGPEHSAPVRLTLAQAFNSIGGTIAPFVAGAWILTDSAKVATKAAIADTVRVPYIVIAAGLLVLGIALAFMHLPHIATQAFRPGKEGDPVLSRSIWRYRHTVLGAVGIFSMSALKLAWPRSPSTTSKPRALTAPRRLRSWFRSTGAGRWWAVLLGSWMLTKIRSGKLVGIFGICGAAMLVVSMGSTGHIAIYSLVACGFFNSIMFPNIFTLGIAGLGPMTSKGSGLIMAAVVGGAVIPAHDRRAGRQGGNPGVLRLAHALLSLYRLLRSGRIKTDPDCGLLSENHSNSKALRCNPRGLCSCQGVVPMRRTQKPRSKPWPLIVMAIFAVLLLLLRMWVFVHRRR